MAEVREQILDIVMAKGYRRLDEAIRLSSGEMSRDFVDAKRALSYGPDLRLACEALLGLVSDAGIDFDAVGGLTLGADQFAHCMSVLSEREWFVVRKQVKEHGTRRRVEGAVLGPGVSALLVDDVVTTGGSILDALAAVRETGADVVCATTLVDRGDTASQRFRDENVPYRSLLTYRDLGIEPVGAGQPDTR